MAKTKKKFVSQEYSRDTEGKNLKEGTRRSRAVTTTITGFFSFALIVGVCLIAFSVIFFFSQVMGTSMMKTLNASYMDTDSVIVNRYKKPVDGEIIVLKHYDANGNFQEYHIKRLIASGGQSVCFRLSDDGTYYIIEVDGVVEDNSLYQLDPDLGRNMKNAHYDALYDYETTQVFPSSFLASSYDRVRYGNPGFNKSYKDASGNMVDFLQFNQQRQRWEFELPQGYMWYMGDNRGGIGTGFDFQKMSIDSTYYGPQPESCIVGTVTELIHKKTAPQWVWDKFVWIITFKWL